MLTDIQQKSFLFKKARRK